MKITNYLQNPVNISPLIVFRILFGTLMLWSIFRFWSNGWIESLYIEPEFHFSYQYFEWIKPLGDFTYVIFALCGLSALMVAVGFKYRLSIIVFFLSFTYIELMDKTTYLNHYYFVSLISFIMIFLPANVYASIDSYLNPQKTFNKVPRWSILILQAMLCIVYWYAGLAKLNSDWLLEAAPLKIWLSSKTYLPIIGELMDKEWFHYAMSWSGALYDLAIPFLLINRKTRLFGFLLVVVFHVFTSILFPIGMFPYIMICATLIFFSSTFHQGILDFFFRTINYHPRPSWRPYTMPSLPSKLVGLFLFAFIIVQLILPFRHLTKSGELFWTEDGFRFSWRVMLMEKAGYITFQVVDSDSGKKISVEPTAYLTPFQIKQMATQPDFILEFAHFLAKKFEHKGMYKPQVYADSYVALNGRRSQKYINSHINLAQVHLEQDVNEWLLPFSDEIKGF
ncbi:HTTM domain-containing protein [Flavobacteriaceae bacterium Ap0902]|nr:HTTM domain-containing protein [Flavobacteriaceae bacterium Ap0902]